MIRFDASALTDLAQSLPLEWLEINGLGGYAMGTVAGPRTRRYHGLFCAALRPPVERHMLLSSLEETVRLDGQEFALSCNLYGDVVHPRGHELLVGFRKDPWPVWTYQAGSATIEKAIVMPHGHNAGIVRYTCLDADHPVTLSARLLVAFRDHHHLGRACVDTHFEVRPSPGGVSISRDDSRLLACQFGDGVFDPASEWYYGFSYPVEAERGLDAEEDLYCPGAVTWTLYPGRTVSLLASLDAPLPLEADAAVAEELVRREAVMSAAPVGDSVGRTLLLAADQFVVARPAQGPNARSIIAGYPWFTDWGRDTMIALPGLLLATGRHAEARSVLATNAAAMQDGLIPNLFPDQTDGAAYNTVDATLWFFASAKRYYDATRDLDLFAEGLYEAMQRAIEAHIAGTHFGIRMGDDGLITAGDETTQLTWMDAKVGDWVVTPRHGKAVEINALWYSAIRTAEFLARKLGLDHKPYAALARRVKDSFEQVFWDAGLGYLVDCVRGEERDASLRPNQVIALAVPYCPLSVDQQRSVLRVVTEKLLTPYGLRTLDPDDLRYRGRYCGDQWSRDGAYHQGTVWPWLLDPYLSACLLLSDPSADTRARLGELIQPRVGHLWEAGLGSVSEVFDGDVPHHPGGCPAQAWSVAALLRAWLGLKLGEEG